MWLAIMSASTQTCRVSKSTQSGHSS